MTGVELAYLILSVVAFTIFGIVLYWVERYCRIPTEKVVTATRAVPVAERSALPVH